MMGVETDGAAAGQRQSGTGLALKVFIRQAQAPLKARHPRMC
jgi:hypothetical protein